MKHTIYNGDSMVRIKEIEDGSVHLTVTSPPYYNAKEYNSEDVNIGNNENYMVYLDKIEALLLDIALNTIAADPQFLSL